MPEQNILGFDTNGWLGTAKEAGAFDVENSEGTVGTIAVVGQSGSVSGVADTFGEELPEWQVKRIKANQGQPYQATLSTGPLWVITVPQVQEMGNHGGYLDPSPYGAARDAIGGLFRADDVMRCKQLLLVFNGASKEEKLGTLVGLECGSYLYKDANRKRLGQLYVSGCSAALIEEARTLGVGTNLARHLVNAPANELNPSTYADLVKTLFKGSGNTKVTVWDFERCQKEDMNLLCAVGQASEHKPCMVHMKYRPKNGRKKTPSAYVGKAITFDSGGLDIKPPAGMRLMKKDMGGSAAVMGLAYWLDRSGYDHPADLYLAVAENAISDEAFRPGDVYTARNGVTVEIDNTDAEGRLVMADVLTVATEEKNKDRPSQVVNLATLTGAMRIALGRGIGGMFSNDDDMADKVCDAAYAMGEPTWRMPLHSPYNDLLASTVADVVNAGGRFGGAITAALFLERFVHDIPWTHMDIFTWQDRPEGCYLEPGGNGQAVQTLVGFVKGLS